MERIFPGDGEMARRMREFDWQRSPLGSPSDWPKSLATAVHICLTSRFPIVLWWGKDLRLLYNDAWRPVLGKTKHPGALGAAGREVWPEIWHIIGPMLEGVLEKGAATWSDDQLLPLDRNGYLEEAYFTYSYSPIPDEQGGVGGVFAAVNETTLKVLAERRLRTLRELAAQTLQAKGAVEAARMAMATLAQNASDVPFALLYLVDGAGHARLEQSSPAGVESTDGRWPVAEAIERGEPILLKDLRGRVGRLPSPWPVPPDHALVLPLRGASQGRVLAVLVLGVNPARELDEEHRGFLDMAARHIANSVASASAYEEERRRAEALAELDRAKTTFFSNVSHEFRTPLTLMLGPVEDILAKPPEEVLPPNRAALEVVHRNGQRLLKLVNTLLDFARIEAGRAQASYEPTDLGTLTAELASNFRSACERAGLRLVVDCPPCGEAYVDREMWEKVVLNLLSNAFKFTLEGEIAVSVRRAGDAFRLEVRDTGSGIPEGALPRMFERFHRVEGARGRSHEGSGIGLALVHELVKLHGGTIGVESKLGAGSTFGVSIPAGSAHLPPDRIRAPREAVSTALRAGAFVEEALSWLGPGSEPAVPTKTGTRVLVADDNADLREYVRRLLAERFEVETAADGEAALAAARARKPDLVVTDVMMPRLDGFGLIRALRAEPALREVPVIALSARAGEEARVEGLARGADDYLTKPFSGRELLVRVEALLRSLQVRREAEERVRAIVETTPECVKLVARDGTLLQMNAAGLGMVGAPSAEKVLGRCIYDVIAPEDRERFRAFNERVCAGERGTLEFDIVGIDGTRRHMETHAVPLARPQGGFDQLAITRDATERKRAEQALREADRRKDEFIAMLSHELRNPLAPLKSGLEIMRLRPGAADERVRAMMERQVNHLVRLVDDLLETSRIQRGLLELRREPVQLADVVRSAVEAAEPLMREAGHRLELDLPREPLWLSADAVRLAQSFANLLNNAARYTPPGGSIWLRAAREPDARVCVSVRDTGAGFSPRDKERLFEMFSRGEGSSGLGIGLALARRLVEMHGGSIDARSEGEGRGAEFLVRLPLAEAPAASAQEPAARGEACRVLVADDNRDAAESIAMLLRALGNEVSIAYDGVEAVAAVGQFMPDVVLLDIGMPRLDGYGAAREIRRHPQGARIRLVALTGWGQDEDKRRAREAGFDTHLVKPADLDALRRVLADPRTESLH